MKRIGIALAVVFVVVCILVAVLSAVGADSDFSCSIDRSPRLRRSRTVKTATAARKMKLEYPFNCEKEIAITPKHAV